jgi:hypothetical protein
MFFSYFVTVKQTSPPSAAGVFFLRASHPAYCGIRRPKKFVIGVDPQQLC